jgi:hypothetical protein
MQESRHSCLALYFEEYEKLTLQAILITNAQTYPLEINFHFTILITNALTYPLAINFHFIASFASNVLKIRT